IKNKAAYNYGLCLEEAPKYGLGSSPDLKSAVKWYQQAAETGHLKSQFKMAQLCEPSNAIVALGWYDKAAAQGHPEARECARALCNKMAADFRCRSSKYSVDS